jgi:glucose-6-phosphate 1-dehydrogenase
MNSDFKNTPVVIVLMGGMGDLAWRKIIPALYNLYQEEHMPTEFEVLSVGRVSVTDLEIRERYKEGVDTFSRSGQAKSQMWKRFSANVHHMQGEFSQAGTYTAIGKKIDLLEKKCKKKANRILYIAVTPVGF